MRAVVNGHASGAPTHHRHTGGTRRTMQCRGAVIHHNHTVTSHAVSPHQAAPQHRDHAEHTTYIDDANKQSTHKAQKQLTLQERCSNSRHQLSTNCNSSFSRSWVPIVAFIIRTVSNRRTCGAPSHRNHTVTRHAAPSRRAAPRPRKHAEHNTH